MVQFFQGLEDPRLAAASQAGQQFGQSLSDVLQQHFVNKSIDKLISDPANKDLSTSERLQKMLGQLSRHGPKGMEEFGRRFQLEQIASQEKEQRKAEAQQKQQEQLQMQQQGLIAKALRGEQLSPQEESILPVNAQLQIAKLKQPKPAPGGISAQPVPPEISQKIPLILAANKEASADELATAFDEQQIPRAFSNSYIENRRRQDESKAKAQLKAGETSRKEQIEFHKETAKLDDKISNEANAAEKKIKAIQKQRELQPQITNLDRLVTATFGNTRFANLLKSKTAQEFDSYALPMVEGQKETFGVRLSDADLKLILQKIATADKNPEANNAIFDWMELDERLKIDRRNIADQIRKENKGLRPLDFESQVRKRMNDKYGDEIQEKASQVLSLTDNASKKESITGRKQVPAGTKLTNTIIDKYLELAGNDPNLASQMAAEDGYSF